MNIDGEQFNQDRFAFNEMRRKKKEKNNNVGTDVDGE